MLLITCKHSRELNAESAAVFDRDCDGQANTTYSWLEIYEDRSWDVVLVICLVEEDILAVSALFLSCVFLQCTILCNSMFTTQMLPEMRSDLVTVAR